MSDQDNSKIFIDDDWKRQAQEEKQRLTDEAKRKQEKPVGRPARPAEESEEQAMPPVSFESLVSTFATQTFLALGMIEHPTAGRTINLEMAKYHIDMLGLLEEKTRGNLTVQEQQMLDQMLHQLRMAFVEVSSMHGGPIGSR